MARSSKLITLLVASMALLAFHGLSFAAPQTPRPVATAAAVGTSAMLMTPTAAMAADGGVPSVVLGVGILCMLAAFSAVSSVISATVTSELD